MFTQSNDCAHSARSDTVEGWSDLVSYAIPCPSEFRAAVLALQQRTGTELAAMIDMALTVVHRDFHQSIPDPGEPEATDTVMVEEVGRFGGRRCVPGKPSLTVRYRRGWKVAALRHALAVAVALSNPSRHRLIRDGEIKRLEQRVDECLAALERLSFAPLPDGIKTPREAAHVMGFSSFLGLSLDQINARFRALAPIYHPDQGLLGSAERMGQLLDARNLLRRSVGKPTRDGLYGA
jgi:hypothetical protein